MQKGRRRLPARGGGGSWGDGGGLEWKVSDGGDGEGLEGGGG